MTNYWKCLKAFIFGWMLLLYHNSGLEHFDLKSGRIETFTKAEYHVWLECCQWLHSPHGCLSLTLSLQLSFTDWILPTVEIADSRILSDSGRWYIRLVLICSYTEQKRQLYHNSDGLCVYVVYVGMPPPSGVGIGSPMHPGSVDRKRPTTTDPRLAQQMKLWVSR